MRRALALMVMLVMAAPLGAETLADIRSEITALGAELTELRGELIATGVVAQRGGGDLLQRLEVIEAELARLTGLAEGLELRINRIVADGTNRLGDLEFRLTDLEGGDVDGLSPPRPLGDATPSVAPSAEPLPGGVAGEQAELDRAREVLGQGDFRRAEALLATHAATWPESPLRAEVAFLRGQALEGLSETAAAARSYLDSFSADPAGPQAGEALVRLGQALAQLGQLDQACQILAEAAGRFPDTPTAAAALAARQDQSCP